MEGIILTTTVATMEADITGAILVGKAQPATTSGHTLLPTAVAMEKAADCRTAGTVSRAAHIPTQHATGTETKALAAYISHHRVAAETPRFQIAPETAQQLAATIRQLLVEALVAAHPGAVTVAEVPEAAATAAGVPEVAVAAATAAEVPAAEAASAAAEATVAEVALAAEAVELAAEADADSISSH